MLESLGDESLRAIEPWERELRRDVAEYVRAVGMENAVKGLQSWFTRREHATGRAFERWLTPALVLGVLAGLSDASTGLRDLSRIQSKQSSLSFADPVQTILNADEPESRAGFDVQFKEAIQEFVDKGVVTPDEFALLEGAAKARAFSVGGLTDRYALEVVKRSLETALEDGMTSNQWLTAIEDKFAESGLNVSEGAAHMRLVYRANVFGAYNAGRWVQQQRTKLGRPYLQRISVAHGEPVAAQIAEANVRPEHAELDGVIRPVDDEFWALNYPPMLLGEYEYNCRCMALSVSEQEMASEGLAVTPAGDLPESDISPEEAQNPAEDFFLGNNKIETGAAGEAIYRALVGV